MKPRKTVRDCLCEVEEEEIIQAYRSRYAEELLRNGETDQTVEQIMNRKSVELRGLFAAARKSEPPAPEPWVFFAIPGGFCHEKLAVALVAEEEAMKTDLPTSAVWCGVPWPEILRYRVADLPFTREHIVEVLVHILHEAFCVKGDTPEKCLHLFTHYAGRLETKRESPSLLTELLEQYHYELPPEADRTELLLVHEIHQARIKLFHQCFTREARRLRERLAAK